jgi:hypothetical protein
MLEARIARINGGEKTGGDLIPEDAREKSWRAEFRLVGS